MQFEFYGASNGDVTGSCHILRFDGRTVLFDCGLIQGSRKDSERNREPFPFDPEDVDLVVLSHAHIDHSGRLPLLVSRGFKGEIHTHNASVELCEILLKDSAKLTKYDADLYNRKNKDKPQRSPLFEENDVITCLDSFVGHAFDAPFSPMDGLTLTFQDSGHILGSATVEIEVTCGGQSKKIVFSGDIGQYDTPILEDPVAIADADMVVMECTYGGRKHRERSETFKEIGAIFETAKAGQGNIIIPAFSIGRTQEILYQFVEHYEDWGLADWKIYLDSPMAIEASKVYWEFKHLHDDKAKRLLGNFGDKIPLPNYQRTVSANESKVLNEIPSGAIFIAGSGMCNGGRIVHHLQHNLPGAQNHVLIVGHQSYGTLGRRLVDKDEKVRIFGQWIPVNAQIHTVGGLSAHADQDDLMRWLKGFTGKPPVYLVHGERDSQDDFIEYAKTKGLTQSIHHPNVGDIVDLKTI